MHRYLRLREPFLGLRKPWRVMFPLPEWRWSEQSGLGQRMRETEVDAIFRPWVDSILRKEGLSLTMTMGYVQGTNSR